MKKRFDLAVIGGGAAGLACAVSAAESGCKSIAVIDRMNRIGKKLPVTGNGRCNLSSRNISEDFYHGSFNVKPVLEEYPDLRPFFEGLGMYTFCDSAGRIYPLSNTASSVLDALRLGAEKSGRVGIFTEARCTSIAESKNGFIIKAGEHEIHCGAAVLACGGCAAAVHGSDGSGFSLAEGLGISVSKPYPALCSLLADGTKTLEGVRSKCGASLFVDGQLEKRERGEVQFTKSGLSGICIFNLSAALPDGEKNAVVSLDLLPDHTLHDVYEMLLSVRRNRSGNLPEEMFSGIFNRKIALFLLKKAGISPSVRTDAPDYTDLKRLAALTKDLKFKITGRADFSGAQVTAGGIVGSEIDESLMSRKIKGLFFAGEIIDVWGDCGGYNLHFAFASGIKAGKAAAKLLSEKEKSHDKNQRNHHADKL